jgi:Ni/Fe-hydrogenase 1 B-type cytochrome subunit
MQGESVRRVLVWPGMLRLTHWLLAASILALLASGWVLANLPQHHGQALDVHRPAGGLFVLALAVRLVLLLFGEGPAHGAALIPRGEQLRAIPRMLVFYFSLARARLPAWYAHNPLWAPVYLLLFAILLVQALTGLFIDAPYLVLGERLPVVHGNVAVALGWIVGLHVLAAFLHDWRGTGSDISAMVNGHRTFVIRPREKETTKPVPFVSLDRRTGAEEER